MSKRSKNLIILLAFVVILAIACLLLSSLNKEDESPVADDAPIVLAEIDGNSVTSVVYEYNGIELSFTNKSGMWSYDGDADFPVTQNTLTTMISDVSVINATRELKNVQDPSEYGFDKPTLVLCITCSGNEYKFEVGDLNSYSGSYYLRYNGGIYMTDELLVSTFSKDLYDYLTTTDLPVLENITGFVVDGNEITDDDSVADLAGSYEMLIRGDVADYSSKESYGFDGTEHTVVVMYTEDNAVPDSNGNPISSVTTEHSYTFSYAYVGEKAYIMLGDDDLIYEVSGTSGFDIFDTTQSE